MNESEYHKNKSVIEAAHKYHVKELIRQRNWTSLLKYLFNAPVRL